MRDIITALFVFIASYFVIELINTWIRYKYYKSLSRGTGEMTIIIDQELINAEKDPVGSVPGQADTRRGEPGVINVLYSPEPGQD